MSHLLEIPDDIYVALQEVAEASGMTPLGWIAAHLPAAAAPANLQCAQEGKPQTLADLFAGRVGRIRSGGQERLSEACNVKFTDYLEAKRGRGCL